MFQNEKKPQSERNFKAAIKTDMKTAIAAIHRRVKFPYIFML